MEEKYSKERHLQTMREELEWIQRKTSDLKAFVDDPVLFNERIKDMGQKRLVEKQLIAMTDYSVILSERIKYFEQNG